MSTWHYAWRPLACALSLALALAPAPARPSPTPAQRYAEAERLVADDDCPGAMEILSALIEEAGQRREVLVEAHLLTGVCRFFYKDKSGARQSFEAAFSLDPGATIPAKTFNPQVVAFFAGVKAGLERQAPPVQQGPDQEQLVRVIEANELIVGRDPTNYQAWKSLGDGYFDIGDPQKSIAAYLRALGIKDTDPNVWTDLGVMYRESKNLPEAVRCFRRAMALSPTHPQSRMNIGIVYMHDLNDPKAAIEAWEDYLRADPKAPNAEQVRQSIEELRRKGDGQ